MRSISVNFGPRRRSLLFQAGWLVLLLGALSVGYEVWRYAGFFKVRNSLEAEQTRLQALLDRASSADLSRTTAVPTEAMVRSAQAMARLKNPWTQLFQDVASAMDEQVGLLGMEPDLAAHEVRLYAEAKDAHAMFVFARRIDKTAVLGKASLDNYQLQIQDPLRPVRFTLVAAWDFSPPFPSVGIDGSRGAMAPGRPAVR